MREYHGRTGATGRGETPAGKLRRALAAIAAIAVVAFGGVIADLDAPAAHAVVSNVTTIPVPSDAIPKQASGAELAILPGNATQTFYAYTAAGEVLQAAFRKLSNSNTAQTIRVTSPSGIESTHSIPTAARNQWGFAQGDLPSEEGIWTIEIVPPRRVLATYRPV